jgi:uncharacterized protein
MDFKQTIEEDLKKALKAGDAIRVSTLRMLLGALQYKQVEKQHHPVSEQEFHAVVKTMIKQHVESIESFKKGQRPELAEKEEKELLILKEFVPATLSEEELRKEVEEALQALEAKGPGDMGKVMKFLMEKVGSRADGKVLSEMVRKRLVP